MVASRPVFGGLDSALSGLAERGGRLRRLVDQQQRPSRCVPVPGRDGALSRASARTLSESSGRRHRPHEQTMNDDPITDDELAELVGRTAEAAAAYMRGDMDTYLGLIHHAPGFTLLRPTGGPPDRFEDRAEGVRASAGFFADGDARLEHVEAHVWGDTVVLAMIERQHGRVGGMPDQDCSLRVTQVYRRDDSGWRLVHRHADPLVDVIALERVAAIARGDVAP